jgi:hypothetical protein
MIKYLTSNLLGPEGPQGPEGPAGMNGSTGNNGDPGTNGDPGANGMDGGGNGLPYLFNTSTTLTPAAGQIRFDNADFFDVTSIAIRTTSAYPQPYPHTFSDYMTSWQTGDYIVVSGTEAKKVIVFRLDTSGTFDINNFYLTFTVTPLNAPGGSFTNGENVTVSYVPQGIAASEYQVVYKNGSGNLVGSANLLYDDSTGLALEGYLAVDGAGTSSPTLKVDALNRRVGIGKYDPGTKLDVDGTVTATNFTGSPTDGTTTTAASGVGYMGLPQNASLTGNIAVVASDAGKHIYSTSTRIATIPANSNVAMPIGTTISFVAGSGATVTIAITSDTMYLAGNGATGSRTLAPFGMATAVKIASTTWIISGNGLT